MDGNKDESTRCIQLAEHYINEGQRDKALKFLEKAEKLYPSQRAKDLIELLQKLDGTANYGNKRMNSSPSSSPSRKRKAQTTSETSEEVAKEYTQEQVDAVRRIKQCKTYYEILGVTKESGDADLKKQYRKLALQFHPDKNKAPGAAEAFKAIGNAFAVLSDAEKRKQYDMYGSDEVRRRHGRSDHDYTRGFEGDIPAEELFNMFFGGGFPTGNVYVRRGARWHQYRQQSDSQPESGYNVLLQIMPVLVLVCLSLMSSFFVSDPPYSLSKSHKYLYERKTPNLGIAYYVKENFIQEYQSNLQRIESQVEEDVVTNLRATCFRERNYKESLLWRARNFRDSDLEAKAKAFRMPSCETLNELYSNRNRG